MKIFINGHEFALDNSSTVHNALAAFLSDEQQNMSFAVALNSDFIAKERYCDTVLSAGDSLDVLFPIQGG